ncbi:sensor histidine kinase [Streptomyces sediminimaris]|uniref:sensor histidine kinase n=1 Tax=Streptomyces sediminimaris TaxID=3383721 RepID=UPI003999AA84
MPGISASPGRSTGPAGRRQRTGPLRGRPLPGRSLRARLLLFTGAVLVVVCAAMALSSAFVQRTYLMRDLDARVSAAAEHGLEGAGRRPDSRTDLSFLAGNGHPPGLLAGRLGDDGTVLSAAVVGQDTPPRSLTTAQRTALRGTAADGSAHTVSVPDLGTYRITALDSDGVRVVAGLPMDGVRHMTGELAEAEAVVATAGLTAAGLVCAVVIRRQLRPLRRVAATAAEVSLAPLDRDGATALTRVPVRDTDPGTEAGQVGAALNRMIDRLETSLAERRSSEERARRSETRMRRFLSDASHELRTPLASIAGYAELMNRGTAPVEPVLAWRRVSIESARLTALVEDLLSLARLEEGRPLQATRVDLAAVVAEAVRQARPAAPGHHWRLGLPLHGPAVTLGEETHLRRAVTNLLTNACTHTPAGTTVVAEAGTTAEHCAVRVRDDGPGIPPELLARVFERFTRADASRSRTPGGAGGPGLGLALAKAIVEAHGGHIDVDSAPGRTEFTILLPRARNTTAHAQDATGGRPATGPSRPSAIGHGTSVTSPP